MSRPAGCQQRLLTHQQHPLPHTGRTGRLQWLRRELWAAMRGVESIPDDYDRYRLTPAGAAAAMPSEVTA